MKSQKCSKSEALLEIGEVPHHAKDQTTCSKTDWQSAVQFVQIMYIKVNKSVYIPSRTYQFCWQYTIILVRKTSSSSLNQLNH